MQNVILSLNLDFQSVSIFLLEIFQLRIRVLVDKVDIVNFIKKATTFQFLLCEIISAVDSVITTN